MPIEHGDRIVISGALYDHHGLFVREDGHDYVIHHTGASYLGGSSAGAAAATALPQAQQAATARESAAREEPVQQGRFAQHDEPAQQDLGDRHAEPSAHSPQRDLREDFFGYIEADQLSTTQGSLSSTPRSAEEESDSIAVGAQASRAAPSSRGQVIQEWLPDGLGATMWRFHSRPIDAAAAVARARAELGVEYYDVWAQNCEHYANYWADGVGWSEQKWTLFFAGGSFAVGGCTAWAFGLGATAPVVLGSETLGSWAATLGYVAPATSYSVSACTGAASLAAAKTFVFGRGELYVKRMWREYCQGGESTAVEPAAAEGTQLGTPGQLSSLDGEERSARGEDQ